MSVNFVYFKETLLKLQLFIFKNVFKINGAYKNFNLDINIFGNENSF